jgi:hypothetical protein
MVNVDLITLSYTFFEAKEGHKLPVPGYNWSSNQDLLHICDFWKIMYPAFSKEKYS